MNFTDWLNSKPWVVTVGIFILLAVIIPLSLGKLIGVI